MSKVFLIPTVLHEEGMQAIPPAALNSIRQCKVIFAENERTTRRYFKKLDPSIVIDEFEWHTIEKEGEAHIPAFKKAINDKKVIGILSEAGCPGIADPGQALVAIAQEMQATVIPNTGPSSIFLALMASGMNGQQFEFCGYLPIAAPERNKKIKEIEKRSATTGCTMIFIETPYRNDQLFQSLVQQCSPETRICIGVEITGPEAYIITRKVKEWKSKVPQLHKKTAVFLLQA